MTWEGSQGGTDNQKAMDIPQGGVTSSDNGRTFDQLRATALDDDKNKRMNNEVHSDTMLGWKW